MAVAKHIIFLVHGMGVYQKASTDNLKRVDNDAWFESTQKNIVDAYNSYPDLKKREFGKYYKFVNINYDKYFDQLLTNTSDTVKNLSIALPGVIPADVVGLFAKSKEIEDNFFWTHVVDVILYKFLKGARRAIKAHVMAKILREIFGPKSKPYVRPRSWSMVAHSLGTIVAHDAISGIQGEALHSGYTKAMPPASIIAMIANVIPPLAMDSFGKPYNEYMRPEGANSIVDNYLSCSHRLDPLVQAFPFSPNEWSHLLPGQEGGDGRFKYLPSLNHYRPDILLDGSGKLSSFDELIPHSFQHYFSNPKVHLPIFFAMDPGFMMRNKAKNKVYRDYEKDTDTTQREAIASLLDNLVSKELEEKDDKRLLEYWRKAFQLLEGAFT